MRPDCRSVSFTWQRDVQNMTTNNINSTVRRRIQDSFENETSASIPFSNERSLRSTLANFSLPSVGVQPRQVIRVGAEKITKTLRDVRTTFDTFSQKLRRSTRRRIPLRNEFSPRTPSTTPRTRSRRLLGRTPTKLYSPFGIDTPRRTSKNTESRGQFPSQRRTPLRSCQNDFVHIPKDRTACHVKGNLLSKVQQPHARKSIDAIKSIF